MPGGQLEESTIQECLKNEIKEELNCKIDFKSLKYIGEYLDIAAGRPNKNVSMKLYSGTIIGSPQPSTEIENIYWIGKDDLNNKLISPIIKNKIIPDLIARNILK